MKPVYNPGMETTKPRDMHGFISGIIDFMALHAGSDVVCSDTPAAIGWAVVWTDPDTLEQRTEQFEVSRDDIGGLVEAVERPEIRDILAHHLRSPEGRLRVALSMKEPSRMKRSRLQHMGKIRPNTEREEYLIGRTLARGLLGPLLG